MKRKSKNQFLEEARSVHGDKYDYSKVEYINGETKVEITCPLHGSFFQKPVIHLRGKGCQSCAVEKLKRRSTEGYNDIGCGTIEGKESPSYTHWKSMLLRCYSQKHLKRQPTYIGCSVCDDWKTHGKFKEWFDENYIEGYSLDKDIIKKGNKVYSPDTCCFVPSAINSLVIKRKKGRGDLPIGVGRANGRYRAFLHKRHLGMFDNPTDAFMAYKKAKEDEIRETALLYYQKRLITERVYNALLNHKVEITD